MTKLTKPWRKMVGWGITGVILLGLVLGYQGYQSQKVFTKQRQAMQVQRQVMKKHWEDQGFSEAEIKSKMRQQWRDDSEQTGRQPSILGRLLFGFRRATGSGRRDR